MRPDLVRTSLRWPVEAAGVIVGDMEMIKLSTGEKTTFKRDGSVIRETTPLSIDWCDRCQMWKPLEFGRYVTVDGLHLIWECMDCK